MGLTWGDVKRLATEHGISDEAVMIDVDDRLLQDAGGDKNGEEFILDFDPPGEG